MLAKTGLLIVSNPKHIGKLLSSVEEQVKSTLYIQLLSALSDPFGSYHSNIFSTWPTFGKIINSIYTQAATHCRHLDVRVLLSGLKHNVDQIKTQRPIDLVIFDKFYKQPDIDLFIKTRIENITKEYNVVTLDSTDGGDLAELCDNDSRKVFSHSVLGGTFDRLHVAHKLLLSEAVLRTKSKLTIGVTDESMIKGKLLYELIEDLDTRVSNVANFLDDVAPEVDANIVPISDPFGPAIVDPSMDLIIVSKETIRGGQKINEIRLSKNLPELEIYPVDLIDEPNRSPIEEEKISSSTRRIRLLGTLLKPVVPNHTIPKKPYVIALAGGIASGKSGVAYWMEKLGVRIIDCDKIGHQIYKSGKPCHKLLVDHFGKGILDENGEIDRKKLGSIVFTNPAELNALNGMVWPAIADELHEQIASCDNEIVLFEGAILIQAGWTQYCHELWATIIPREEAIKRLVERNNLTEAQANSRIDSQPSNLTYVKAANVVFCTLWEREYTKQQVDRAYTLLKDRISKNDVSKVTQI